MQPGIVGIAEVVKEAYPDPTQFDPKSAKYDAKSTHDDPRWDMVDIKLVGDLEYSCDVPAGILHFPNMQYLRAD